MIDSTAVQKTANRMFEMQKYALMRQKYSWCNSILYFFIAADLVQTPETHRIEHTTEILCQNFASWFEVWLYYEL